MSWYPWNPAVFDADPNVAVMNDDEELLYRRCLDKSWLGKGLSTNTDAICRLVRFDPEKFKRCWPAVFKCFELKRGRLVNARQEGYRLSVLEAKTRMSAGGRRGASVRWKKDLGDSHPKNNPNGVLSSYISISSPSSLKEKEGVQGEEKQPPDDGFQRTLFDSVRALHPKGGDEVSVAWEAWREIFPKPDQVSAERMCRLLAHKYPKPGRSWLPDESRFVKALHKMIRERFFLDELPTDRRGRSDPSSISRPLTTEEEDQYASRLEENRKKLASNVRKKVESLKASGALPGFLKKIGE